MATRYHQQQIQPTRPPSRHGRVPLGPGGTRQNINPPSDSVHRQVASSSPPKAGMSAADKENTSPHPSGGNKRVSDIKNDVTRNTKRDSEISNASTTGSGRGIKRTIGQWSLGKTVGRGGCSTVREVRHVVTHEPAAVKIISRKMAEQVRAQSLANLAAEPIPEMTSNDPNKKAYPPPPPGLMREIAIMKLLDHPNIVRLYDVWENQKELYLVMEYVKGGELFHYVEEHRGLEECESVYIFRQIIAALLYCHRLHIHHRDLKPENILLDRDNAQVKLVDFGMAALQPEGKQLTTACGSPHYAAPEVIKSRPYDGAKADVWSCGVILYVMLTGTTPFNYDGERNLAVMYHAIAMADYYMPPELSPEAQDLLRRIFVPRPDRRISMDEIWDHPLMHKFNAQFGYQGDLAKKESWIGPSPQLDQWTVTRKEDIDMEIIRNLRPLWHSVPEDVLLQKLISKVPNQEKYFYAALLKHREEMAENFTGGSDGISISPSDYRHTSPAQARGPAIPTTTQQSQSSYSIMNNEHLRSSSIPDVPSESSYDPYRPGRYPLANKTNQQPRTVVHKRGQSGSAKGSALRVETLKKAGRQATQARVSAPHTRSHSRSVSRSSVGNRASRQSLTSSSLWPSSPPVVAVRSGASHKRNVSFQHTRKSSVASAMTAGASVAALTPELQQKPLTEDENVLESSPTARAALDAQSRKSKAPAATPRSRARKPETPGHLIRSEVRKVSSELEKACEEAFFRSSYGSSTQTSNATERQSAYDTPPSSVSGHGHVRPASAGRPLPAVPSDTPNTFIARTLEETRLKLATAAKGSGNAARYQEILASLEKIMPREEIERRVTSAPEYKSAADLGFLPIIAEEPLPDTLKAGKERSSGRRSFTAPGPPKEEAQQQTDDTIRVVQPSPQNPRAHSTENHKSQTQQEDEIPRPKTADGTSHNTHLQVPNPHEHLLRKNSHDSAVGLKLHNASQPENLVTNQDIKKKSSWFKRWGTGKEMSQSATQDLQSTEPHPGVPVQFEETEPLKPKPSAIKRDKQPPQPLKLERPEAVTMASYASSEFPVRRVSDGNESKFSKWFGKKPWDKKEEQIRAIEIKDSSTFCPPTNLAPNSFLAPPSPPITPVTPATPSEPTRSWFARFLRLRPESKVLCFSVPRGRARSETYRLLRDWQKHGIADLCYFPTENMITGRVDKNNALGIKPVSFRVELFVVLQNGRKIGMSLARWTQTRGAASSFRQVVDVVENSMRMKGVLIEDQDKCKELEGILG